MHKKTLTLVIAGMLALLFMLFRERESESIPLVLEPKILYTQRALEMPPAESQTRASRIPTPATDRSTVDDPSTPLSTTETTRTIEIAGHVLEAGSMTPLERYSVTFTWQRDRNRKKPPSVKALTDARGGFHASLDEVEWSRDEFCPVEIRDRADASVYFGVVSLRGEHTFLVEPVVHAHGKLVANRDIDFLDTRVRISAAPDFETGVHLYCADVRLEPDGQFHAEFVPRHRIDRFELVFTCKALPLVAARVTTADLTSDEGALIRCSLGEVRLTIVDESARPIDGADVRVQSHGLVHAEDGWSSRSDVHGRVEFLLEDGTFEFCAGKEGYVPEHFSCTVAPNDQAIERAVVLTALGQADEISGIVLSPRDEPLRNAVVTAEPRTEDLGIGMAGYVQARTDDHGRFHLPVRLGLEILLVAFHKDYGTTPEFPIVARRAPVELRFEARGAVELHLRGTISSNTVFADPIEYGFLDEHRDRSFIGRENTAPILIEEIPAGDYTAVVRMKGIMAYGTAKVTVEAGTTQRVEVALTPASTFLGSVVRANGAAVPGIVATLHHPLWMHELESWGRSRTGLDGRFSIFGGDLARAEISFLEGPRTIARTQAFEDVPVLVRSDG